MPAPPMKGVEDLVDPDSFRRDADDLKARDPLGFPGYRDALTETGDRARDDALIAGAATIEGHDVEVAAFDFSFLGGSMGEVVGERIARAIERAAARGVPFVLRTASGGARMQEGMAALVQMPKLVAARFALAEARRPYIAVLGHPTTGGVLASIAALADMTIAESDATIGFAGPRVVEMTTGAPPSPDSHTAESAFANGLVDAVATHDEVRDLLRRAVTLLAPDQGSPVDAPAGMTTAGERDGSDAVTTARAATRLKPRDLARDLLPTAVPIKGDRAGGRDPALTVTIGRILERRVLVMALDPTHSPGPAAYRTARRALRVAERLGIPVLTLIDTPGADPSESSEAGGIAWEIAQLFAAMLVTEVPIVAVVTGEGGSGGALAFATADVLLAYEGSIFSVIAPEAAATILWRDATRGPDAARALKPTAAELARLGIADGVLPDPPEPSSLARTVAYHLDRLSGTSGHDLVVSRTARWRRSDGNR